MYTFDMYRIQAFVYYLYFIYQLQILIVSILAAL